MAAALGRLPAYARDAGECVRVFRRPVDVLRCYLTRTTPPGGIVETRSGRSVRCSSDPADVVTAVAIFARRDLGPVAAGSTVVDIGANIGVFALYAIECGAASVHAYEPSAESYDCLVRNIADNGLVGRIVPHRLAVTGTHGAVVRFPRRSNVMNTIGTDADPDCDEVATTSLGEIMAQVGRVDLVKIDCEGGEYDILLTLPAPAFAQMREVRLEYHHGRRLELCDAMTLHGFRSTRQAAGDADGGVVWFARA